MSTIWLSLIFLFLLILLNGIFAMSEIAVVSAKKARLQHLADEGSRMAVAALELTHKPTRFLSTVQIGITLVGILAGAYGEKTIARELTVLLGNLPVVGRYSETVSLIIVVGGITYLSVVVGELVPKRLGMQNAERISLIIARPMQMLSWLAAPFVSLLSASTDVLLRVLGATNVDEEPVSEEEIKILVDQGVKAGFIAEAERDMVESVFRFGDRRLEALMTPRTDVVWIDINAPEEKMRQLVEQNIFSRYPVCDGELDRVIGVVRTKDLLARIWAGEPVDLQAAMQDTLFLPESMLALKALERFRETGIHMGLLVDEFGGVEGLVTLIDILEALVGDIPTVAEMEDPPVVKRDDGSWLIDALYLIDEFKVTFGVPKMPGEGSYQTLGGFVVFMIGRIPRAGDKFTWEGWQFEVVDMDGNRVDKVLLRQEAYQPDQSEVPEINERD